MVHDVESSDNVAYVALNNGDPVVIHATTDRVVLQGRRRRICGGSFSLAVLVGLGLLIFATVPRAPVLTIVDLGVQPTEDEPNTPGLRLGVEVRSRNVLSMDWNKLSISFEWVDEQGEEVVISKLAKFESSSSFHTAGSFGVATVHPRLDHAALQPLVRMSAICALGDAVVVRAKGRIRTSRGVHLNVRSDWQELLCR